MILIRELLAEAVETCAPCGGSGYASPPTESTVRWCYYCQGSGETLTDQGHHLVEFLAKWLTPKFADADHFHDHEHGI